MSAILLWAKRLLWASCTWMTTLSLSPLKEYLISPRCEGMVMVSTLRSANPSLSEIMPGIKKLLSVSTAARASEQIKVTRKEITIRMEIIFRAQLCLSEPDRNIVASYQLFKTL